MFKALEKFILVIMKLDSFIHVIVNSYNFSSTFFFVLGTSPSNFVNFVVCGVFEKPLAIFIDKNRAFLLVLNISTLQKF